MPSKKSPKISETFEGFGVRMEYGDLELKRGPVAVAGSRGRIGAPLWAAYSFHTFVPLERIARKTVDNTSPVRYEWPQAFSLLLSCVAVLGSSGH